MKEKTPCNFHSLIKQKLCKSKKKFPMKKYIIFGKVNIQRALSCSTMYIIASGAPNSQRDNSSRSASICGFEEDSQSKL